MTFAEGGTEVLGYIRIGYQSDTCADYVDGLTKANTLPKLQAHVHTYRRVANDAWQIVERMEGKDFAGWLRGLRSERRGRFAGEEWAMKYGAVLMPEVLMQVGLIAEHFKAPWGCTYIRCKEEKMISESGNIARWVGRPAESENDDR